MSDMYFPCRNLERGDCPALPEDVPCWESFGWEGISEIERSHKPKKKKEKRNQALKPNGGRQGGLSDLWIGWPTELFHTGSIPVPYGIRVGWAK